MFGNRTGPGLFRLVPLEGGCCRGKFGRKPPKCGNGAGKKPGYAATTAIKHKITAKILMVTDLKEYCSQNDPQPTL